MVRESLSWLSPSPTWGDIGDLGQEAIRDEFLRPAILRFAHDGFMDELLAALAYHPDRLGEWRAVAETWEKPMRTPPAAAKLALAEPVSALSVQLTRRRGLRATGSEIVKAPPAGSGEPPRPLKLYQPVQLRHYLVTASLVCQRPGLPDRRIDPGKQERAAFVLRRILLPEQDPEPAANPQDWEEYAFIQGEKRPRWQRVKDVVENRADRVLPGEERLPLFSVGFEETPERKRRLFGGTIPVGRREAYVAAGVQTETASGGGGGSAGLKTDPPATDPRRLLFQMQVTGPWRELVQQMLDEIERFERDPAEFLDKTRPPSFDPDPVAVKRAREQAQTISWYVLLDFERFLFSHLRRIHDVLAGRRSRSELDAQKEEPLLAWLEHVILDAALRGGDPAPSNLLQVLTLLARTPSIGEDLEKVDVPYDADNLDNRWPKFLFPLADVLEKGPFPFTVAGIDLSGHAGKRDATLASVDNALTKLADLVERALPAADAVAAMPEIHIQAPPELDNRAAWFAIRCVYERPNCGPFDPPVVSEPTRPFQLAGFFDPDAPARPIRIPMPLDISPAGLRKFPKGATLLISDMLCTQLKRIRKLTLGDLVLSVLPWPFHKDLPKPEDTGPCEDGDSCSLSIPIVTLCALILLIIMVTLFNIFFWWLPLLFFCFPIKLFSGKPKKLEGA